MRSPLPKSKSKWNSTSKRSLQGSGDVSSMKIQNKQLNKGKHTRITLNQKNTLKKRKQTSFHANGKKKQIANEQFKRIERAEQKQEDELYSYEQEMVHALQSEQGEKDIDAFSSTSDQEQDEEFEKYPRTFKNHTQEVQKMPKIDQYGNWIIEQQTDPRNLPQHLRKRQKIETLPDEKNVQSQSFHNNSSDESIELNANTNHESIGEGESLEDAIYEQKKQILLQKTLEERIKDAKIEIAIIAESILENPEKNIKKMRGLLAMCSNESRQVQRLAILSAVEIFVDILPSYRIKLVSEEEESKMSKDVKKLRAYEKVLLSYYASCIKVILPKLKKLYRKTSFSNTALAMACVYVQAAAQLLSHNYHFNYRKDLLQTLIPLLNSRSDDIRHIVVKCVRDLLQSDGISNGDCALEAVKLIAKSTTDSTKKRKIANIHPDCLDVLTSIPFNEAVLNAVPEKKPKLSRKKKKKMRDNEPSVNELELQRDIAEGSAVVPIEHRQKCQQVMLTELMACYFRLLKSNAGVKLLRPVLKGLAKFAHLINVDLVLDLLDCLKAVVFDASLDVDLEMVDADGAASNFNIDTETALNCIVTAFTVMHGQGQMLSIDLHSYFGHAFNLLWRFVQLENVSQIPLLLKALDLMFLSTKQLSTDRVAAFVKRLCTLSLCWPPHSCLALIHFFRHMARKYPSIYELFAADPESTIGVHAPFANDPDNFHAFSTIGWELTLLSETFHPAMGKQIALFLKREELPLELDRISVSEVYAQYDTSTGGFNPPMQEPSVAAKDLRHHGSIFALSHARRLALRGLTISFAPLLPLDSFDDTEHRFGASIALDSLSALRASSKRYTNLQRF